MKRIFENLRRYFAFGYQIAVLDLQKGLWIVDLAPSRTDYLRAENANGRHILVQPWDVSCYLLADDLDWSLVCAQHRHPDGAWKPGRMVIETSPQNYQVWIHSQRPLLLMEKRYWLKRLGSDPGADPNNRWGRCPGFRNRKEKHRDESGQYPLSRLIWVDWEKQAQIPRPVAHLPANGSKPLSHHPSGGGVCHKKEVYRRDFIRGNESTTDFSYALALARRGHNEDEIRRRILSERSSWENHQGAARIDRYLERTIRRLRIERVFRPGTQPNFCAVVLW